jgi:hypothetical protein
VPNENFAKENGKLCIRRNRLKYLDGITVYAYLRKSWPFKSAAWMAGSNFSI